ncbi:MAG TPA: aminotransferase class I/II-fold pyridoxal phosphate-dependent enzyme [Geobacterales bacterium]|nr:aminotransferase class I/II-fold pyridoxal phosphate-dependent enzyme [Geobacterales bacterium]
MVELFEWQEKDCKINLATSGIEPFTDIEHLEKDDEDPLYILAERYNVKKENVVIVHGAQEGLFFSLMAMKPKEIFIPLPAYPPMFEQAFELGIKVNFVDDVYSLKNKVIVMSNPNNPTGEYINIEELVSNNNIVIVDEIFKYFVTEKDEFIDNTILISSTSKFFNFKNKKVGWVIAGKELSKKIAAIRDLISPEPISEKGLLQLIYKNFDVFKKRNREIISKNLNVVRKMNVKKFNMIYKEMMPVMVLERKGLDSLRYCNGLLKEKGILLTPLHFFKWKNGVRLFIGTSDHEKFKKAISEINNYNEKNLLN